MVFPGDAASAAESSRTKFSRQTEKASANFSGAKIRGAHFPAGGIFVSVLAGQQPRTPRFQTVSTFFFGASRPTSSISIHQPQRPTRQSPNAFLQLRFSRRENTRCIFGSIQNHRFRLGRPIPPATILFIPAPQSSISQLPSFRLGRPTPYIPSHHFFNIHKASSSHQVSLPTILPKSANYHLPQHLPAASPSSFQTLLRIIQLIFFFPFFHFLYRVQHPPGFHLFVPPTPISSHHSPYVLHFRPAAASQICRPNAKHSFARGCSLQGCRWCGRGARVSFFSFFFYFFLLLSFLSPFSSPWRRGFAATPSFFFLLLFFFLFFSFCFFSLYFYSDFLFLFFLCFLFLIFLSFCVCSYLCFLYFIFAFVFFSLFFFLFLSFFLLSFYLCFSFLFFLPLFCFTFLPSSSSLPPFTFFLSVTNLSHLIHPLPGSSKKEKNIGKRINGG